MCLDMPGIDPVAPQHKHKQSKAKQSKCKLRALLRPYNAGVSDVNLYLSM